MEKMRISYPTDPQQIDNYPCKVNVADNHDVEVTEEFQFLEVDGSLSVALRGFLQVTNGPGREREEMRDQMEKGIKFSFYIYKL